jgi:hypothetical protein
MGHQSLGGRHLQAEGEDGGQRERDGKAGNAGRSAEPVEDLAQDSAGELLPN